MQSQCDLAKALDRRFEVPTISAAISSGGGNRSGSSSVLSLSQEI